MDFKEKVAVVTTRQDCLQTLIKTYYSANLSAFNSIKLL